MSCNGFEKYICGEWTHVEFEKHLQACDECQLAVQKDHELLDLSRSLKSKVEAPFLWPHIETALLQEASTVRSSDNYRWIFRIAALLILTLGIVFIFRLNSSSSDSGLLAKSALKKVEQQEQKYQAAIDELEKAVAPQFSQLDQELMLLYRDRLETIDAQIEQCQEALATNPANAHIRRYLLAALHDKKETLKEIIKLEMS